MLVATVSEECVDEEVVMMVVMMVMMVMMVMVTMITKIRTMAMMIAQSIMRMESCSLSVV